jgi:hypothetical protein
MKLRNLSGALLAAGLMSLTGAAHAALTITLNPSACNGDCSTKQIDAATGAFTANSIQTSLSSMLDIGAATGTGIGWSESGALIFNTYNNGSQHNDNRTFAGNNYDVYGIFQGSGIGDWSGNQFNVTGIGGFSINIYASPATGTALTLATPTSGTQANGGVTGGSKDFLLGTATFAGSFGGTNAQLGNALFCGLAPANCATTQLSALFAFTPASASYTGVGGYFQAPTPFILQLNGSGSSNAGQSLYTSDASGIHIATAAGAGATGNITPEQAVPEPSALALAGIGLLGLAAARKRKGAKAA